MKRNIEVKEKNLIHKLNDRVNAMDRGNAESLLQDANQKYWVGVDVASEPDRGVTIRWDNHGPVQFEEEDTKTTIVKENPEIEANCNAYYNADNEETLKEWDKGERPIPMPEGEVTINLDPTKNMTAEDKMNFNSYGPCDINEVGGDYKEDEDNLTDAEKSKRYANFMANLKKACGKNVDTRLRPQDLMKEETHYEEVNHPSHYNNYDVEVIDMMERVFGPYDTYAFCKLNAFKYRMRAGTKPGQDTAKDLKKEQWYLNKAEELKKHLKATGEWEMIEKAMLLHYL